MQRRLLTFLVLGTVMCLSTAAFAVTTIDAGNHVLPDVPGSYVLDITANGSDPLQGVRLNVYTGTGASPVSDAPGITAITVIAPGMVFGANNTGENLGVLDQNAFTSTTTSSGTVDASTIHLLGQVTIDTTGFGPGVYPLIITGGGPFEFVPSDFGGPTPVANLINGTITIAAVPEPSSIVLGLFAAAGMAAVVIRRRRAA